MPNGNLLSRTRIGAKTISYDANGNMLSDGTRALSWDASNRLSTVTQNGATVTLAYGPDGARVKKSWSFGTTLYPDANVEIDRTTPGTDIYTLYPHPDAKIVITAGSTTQDKSFLHRDHLASVRQVTNESGTLVEQTGYAAFWRSHQHDLPDQEELYRRTLRSGNRADVSQCQILRSGVRAVHLAG
ncbi:hypothetical protein [Rhizobium sp. BR 249]|uniref:hypothetical protein n=1 Tax=Rhizobium sp. BR 249 TaxID=3040011 RepID=UPI0039BF7648